MDGGYSVLSEFSNCAQASTREGLPSEAANSCVACVNNTCRCFDGGGAERRCASTAVTARPEDHGSDSVHRHVAPRCLLVLRCKR
ncbi:hypothetical protein BHE74_00014403 [Ensete ventricosum]|nr:hypothetical protein BHE74_00014403 [Ensete ventricosum]